MKSLSVIYNPDSKTECICLNLSEKIRIGVISHTTRCLSKKRIRTTKKHELRRLDMVLNNVVLRNNYNINIGYYTKEPEMWEEIEIRTICISDIECIFFCNKLKTILEQYKSINIKGKISFFSSSWMLVDNLSINKMKEDLLSTLTIFTTSHKTN